VDWYIRNASAGRLKLFGDGVLAGTAGTGDAERSTYGFSGAPGVNVSALYDLDRRCEWYLDDKFHVLGLHRSNSETPRIAPDDQRWTAEADACVWVAQRSQFVFEIKSDRQYRAALQEAAAHTLNGCKMLITFKSILDSQIWAQHTQENFEAFMAGAPIYLTVSDISVINASSGG
jgi:hypothetical protein